MNASQCLIGSILINPDTLLPIARGIVSAADFGSVDDKAIFEAACMLADDGETVDPVTILRKTGEMGEAIPGEYVRDLMLMTPTSEHGETYARELVIESARRRMIALLEEGLARVSSGEALHQAGAWLRNEAGEIAERTASGGLISSLSAMLSFNEYRCELESGKAPAVVATGYAPLDELLGGGFAAEGLYILAARPGAGKTTFALNVAERVAGRGDPVLMVSLEMSLTQLTAKRIAIETGISSSWLLNNPETSGERWNAIHDASIRLSKKYLQVNRAKSASVDDVEKMASQISGLRLVIIDYLGLLRHGEGRTLYERVTATSNALKRLARTLSAPVLCLAQLNREVESRRGGEPRMSDLRDSGAIEQDADGIILMHRHKEEQASKAAPVSLRLAIVKNRHCGTGDLELDFYLANGRVR